MKAPEPLSATITETIDLPHPVAEVWRAYTDTSGQQEWGVPDGEELVFDLDDLRSGGTAVYRCGTPGELEFTADIDYLCVEHERFIVQSDTVRNGASLLSASLLTTAFEAANEGTRLTITDQVVSFVGPDMLEGHRNGHAIVLRQFADHLRN